jgi:hypothetical protein
MQNYPQTPPLIICLSSHQLYGTIVKTGWPGMRIIGPTYGLLCQWVDTIKLQLNVFYALIDFGDIYNIRTLSVNIKFICTSFRNRQNSESLASFSGLFVFSFLSRWFLFLLNISPNFSNSCIKYERRGMTLVSVLFV